MKTLIARLLSWLFPIKQRNDWDVLFHSRGAPLVEPDHWNKWEFPKDTWLSKRKAKLTGGQHGD